MSQLLALQGACEPIAILGMGCRLPGGITSPDEFWQLLIEGRDAITEVPPERWDLLKHFHPDPQHPLTQHVRLGGFVDGIDQFDPGFFGISPREAACMDPQQRLLLEVVWRAMEDGFQPLESLQGRSVGVFMGISTSDYRSLLWASDQKFLVPDNEPFVLSGNTGSIGSNRISYQFDLRGPSFSIDTACSSSLVAVHQACESLWRGESELALAGGVQALIHPGVHSSFCKAGLLSTEGRCRSFASGANGYVRSEGAGAVLLKPLSAARRDGDCVQALIRGTAVNSDGRSKGMVAPSQRAQEACLRTAYERAGLDPAATHYVEAHGTGTRQGDPIELRALGRVLRVGRAPDRPCRVGSVKSNLGHGETAAGITGLIKAVLCLRHGQLPASLHSDVPNPSIDFAGLALQLQSSLEPFPTASVDLDQQSQRVVGVSSFGFGGTNAHAVLSDAGHGELHCRDEGEGSPDLQLLVLSARSAPALDQLCLAYGDWLDHDPELNVHDLCVSTHRGRSRFSEAIAFLFVDREDLSDQLHGRRPPCWRGVLPDRPGLGAQPLPGELQDLQLGDSGERARQRLEALVQAIAAGCWPDWIKFYKRYPHRWVTLPEHPFLRQRFWWPSASQGLDEPRQAPAASLWLDQLGFTDVLPQQGELSWQQLDLPGDVVHLKAQLDARREVDLAEHRIRGQLVFPAAGHLAMALDFQHQHHLSFCLKDLNLDAPLRLDVEEIVALQGVLNGEQLQLFSRSADIVDPPPAWQRHGSLLLDGDSTLNAQSSENFGRVEALDGLVQGRRIDVEAFYAALARMGLEYGPSYRSIEVLHADDNAASATLKRRPGAPDRCLLDGCFQAVAAALPAGLATPQLLLPVGVETLRLHNWPLPDLLGCHVSLRPQASDDLGVVLADLRLEADGEPLGEIRGLRLRRLPRVMLDMLFPSTPPLGPELVECLWQPLLLNETALVDGKSSHQGNSPEPVKTHPAGEEPHFSQAPPLLANHVERYEPASADVQEVLRQLMARIGSLPAQDPITLQVIVRDRSPAASALRAALRSLALERPQWRCCWLQLPSKEQPQPDPEQMQKLLALSEEHRELCWQRGTILVPRLCGVDAERLQWLSDGSGRLEGLQSRPKADVVLMPGELELAVEATGLNFRDVLNALGLLNDHAVSLGLDESGQLPFGGEAVGRVVAVGDGVDEQLLGQRVLAALTVGSLASHVAARAELCLPWPETLPLEVGASVSTAFLTAMHGLETLAALQPGETVLIHAAAGGVGQAALQIAQRCGARILATASAGKQQLVLQQPGVEAVFDSRSTSFAEQVLKHTGGRGVDVVLNSLKGEWVDASFQSLAKGGRFVELGKLEVWSHAEVQQRRPDVAYYPFDLLDVAAADPLPLRRQLQELIKELEKGLLKPIPTQVFPIARCEDAFRLMAQGRHVGKLVIEHPQRPRPLAIRSDATYLLTGASGGLGLQLLPWLAAKGVRSLLLLLRSLDVLSPQLQTVLDGLTEQGVQCQLLAFDLAASGEDWQRQRRELDQALGVLPVEQPLRGVIHAAGVLRDRPLNELDPEDLAVVLAPKVAGWQLLESALSDCKALEFVVGFSSVAALFGSPGQIAYAAANGALESSCYENNDVEGCDLVADGSQDPVRLAVQWGPWAGAGMAAGLDKRFASVGLAMLEPSAALKALESLLFRGRSGVVAVLDVDWARLISQAPAHQRGLLAPMQPDQSADVLGQIQQQLREVSPGQREAWLVDALRQRLAVVMEADSKDLDADTSLFTLGLDSLMGVEFAAVVQSEMGLRLELEAFQDDPSLADLASLALQQLLPNAEAQESLNLLDLAQEARLPEDWQPANSRLPDPEAIMKQAPGERVLCTGASGFLGAYLLAGQLRRWPQLQLRCLVRSATAEQGLERIETNLRRYGLWDPAWRCRLEAVPGDLGLPGFGLDPDHFRALADGVGGILHNGAQLSQMAPYAQLSAANVGGTRELLRLATQGQPLRLELISSVAVFEADAYRNCKIRESDPLPAWQGIQLGYSQTKWVSDQLVLAAGQAGLPVTIYRPPLIGGSSFHSDAALEGWNQGDLLQRLLQGCLILGQVPDLEWELDAVPVDYVADAVTALAWSSEAQGCCFHLQHPKPQLLRDLVVRVNAQGLPLVQVPMETWLETISAAPENPLHSLLPFLEKRWGVDGLTYPERNARGVRARPCCLATLEALHRYGVQCPDYEQLETIWAEKLLGMPVAL